MRQSRKAEAYVVSIFILFFNYYIYRYIFLSNSLLFNISSTLYYKFALKHPFLFTQLFFKHSRIYSYHFEDFLNSLTNYNLKVTLLKIRPWHVPIDLMCFKSSYSLEVSILFKMKAVFLTYTLALLKLS